MGTRLKRKPEATLYDKDFYLWAQTTADAVQSGEITPIDRDHIAEELADMARRDERELKSRTRNVIHHLLKWVYQPTHRSSSWQYTIVRDRAEIEDLIEQSPSLEYYIRTHMDRVYEQAVRLAIAETGLDSGILPRQCPFSFSKVVDPTFFPDEL